MEKIDWESEKLRLNSLIKDGVSYEKIGKIYGVTGNAIKKAARRLGIVLMPRRRISTNEHFNRGKTIKATKGAYNDCPICGRKKYKKSKLCIECRLKERRNSIKERTLFSYIGGHKYLATKCNEIRKDARRTLEESQKEKVCTYCKNHEFDKILEVHHLKGILEFDQSDTIGTINNIDNLVWMCPNHHRMLELGLINLNDAK